MAWWNNQGIASSNLNVRPDQQQYFSGTNPGAPGNWRNANAINYGNTYPQTSNTLEQDMANVVSNTSQEEFDEGDDGTYNEMRGIHFKDQPIEKWRNRLNHPMKGLLDQNFKYRALNQGTNEATQDWLNKNQGDGIMSTDQAQKKGWDWSKFPNPMNALKAMLGAAKDNPQEKFNKEYFNATGGGTDLGRIGGNPAFNLFAGKNPSSIFGSGDLSIGGQKRIDSVAAAIAGMNEEDPTEGKFSRMYKNDRNAWNRRLTRLKQKHINFSKDLSDYRDQWKVADAPAAVAKTTYTGPVARDFDPKQDTGRRPDRPGGFTDPGKGSYGPWMAQGGRAGYAFGDRVAQETDFIEGPQGGEEFQETVVEGQEQPSREQLEALAMAIFQLPLEELDEQQLLVVYQEAMQGQPMEEAVEEEDVQFAAQGGLAGLL